MNRSFLDGLGRSRRSYFGAQEPKPEGGGNPGKLPKKVAQGLLAGALEKLDSVQAELAFLDEHPARLRLLAKIKDIGKVRGFDKVAEAEKMAEPNRKEKEIMDRIIKLVRDKRSLKKQIKFLQQFVGNG